MMLSLRYDLRAPAFGDLLDATHDVTIQSWFTSSDRQVETITAGSASLDHGQVNGLISAMAGVHRETFVAPAKRASAYADVMVETGPGRWLIAARGT